MYAKRCSLKDVSNLVSHMKSYSDCIYSHCVRVRELSIAMGERIGLSDRELYVLGISSLLHDYGKLFIPREVLFKEGPLSKHERKLIEYHVELGYVWLEKVIGMPVVLLAGVSQHHERLDGTGYPHSLKEISLPGKIIAVADVFDAVTHERCYKSALTREYALSFMEKEKDTKFDGGIVNVLKEVV